jgi:hypothetical protein
MSCHKVDDMFRAKMYILIKEKASVKSAILACSRASLDGYLTFIEDEKEQQSVIQHLYGEKTETEMWVRDSFCIVVCSVNDDQFNEAKSYGIIGSDFRVITEDFHNGFEIAIVFKPKVGWEPFFKDLPLYGKV